MIQFLKPKLGFPVNEMRFISDIVIQYDILLRVNIVNNILQEKTKY